MLERHLSMKDKQNKKEDHPLDGHKKHERDLIVILLAESKESMRPSPHQATVRWTVAFRWIPIPSQSPKKDHPLDGLLFFGGVRGI